MVLPSYNRQPGESAQAFEALQLYLQLRADRSLDAVARKCGKNRSLLSRWSQKWEWVNRAREYDDWLNTEQRQAFEARARVEAERWVEIDTELRNEKLQVARLIIDKVRKMLEFPLATVRREQGPDGAVVTVMPARWSMGSISRLAETAFELSRQAVKNEGSLTETGEERDEAWLVQPFKDEEQETP